MSYPEEIDVAHGLIACPTCDLLHQVHPLPVGGKACCVRCGALLYRHIPDSLNRTLALYASALVLFIIANSYPFLALELNGRVQENLLISGALAMFGHGMPELGVVVLLTSVLFPLTTIAGMLYLLLPLRLFGLRAPATDRIYRTLRVLAPWSLVGVFMLGVLVAIFKLLDMADVIPGVALFAFAALLLVSAAAEASIDDALFWPRSGWRAQGTGRTAAERGLVSCHSCRLLLPAPPADGHACPRCEAPLHQRKRDSINRTWALLAASAILLLPANLYPVMTVIYFGAGEPSTILGGVVKLIEGDMWPLALLIFFASIVVPVTKLVVLGLLLVTVQRRSSWRPRDRTRLYRVTEVIGAWSMVDVFLVAILTALVSLGAFATVEPDIGVTFFAAVVVITMLAARSFDPRLIWDNADA